MREHVTVLFRKVSEDAKKPVMKNEGVDAAYDLFSIEQRPLAPGARYCFSTGLEMEIPLGWEGIICDKSGLAYTEGLHCLAGTIDASYRQVVGVVLINLGSSEVIIEKGQKVAQIKIRPVPLVTWTQSEVLSETARTGGFGSQGKF